MERTAQTDVDIPTSEEVEEAIKQFAEAEPEIPFNLHPSVTLILAAARLWCEGSKWSSLR